MEKQSLIAVIKCAYDIAHQCRVNLLLAIENDSDGENEQIAELVAMEADTRLRPNVRQPPRHQDYITNVVCKFTTREFQSHFRMNPETVNELENLISPLIIRQADGGRCTLHPRKQILSVMWLLATPDSYRSIGETFSISKSSLHHCFRRVYKSLNILAPQIISWPSPSQKQTIKRKFEDMSGLPDIVGAIDGCHIEIDAPEEQPAAYRTGKKKYAIQLQAVCAHDLVFTDVFAGYPGSVHDARVFRNSPLYRDAAQLFEMNEYIIGDKAYHPVHLWCIPPYKNIGNLSLAETNFNNKLSKARQIIERAFCLLKGRFRRLKHLNMIRVDEIAPTIVASCVLHNLCLTGLHETQEELENYIAQGSAATEEENIEAYQDEHVEVSALNAALSKRDYLKNLVFNN